MAIDAIGALGSPQLAAEIGAGSPATAASFSAQLEKEFKTVNDKLVNAESELQSLASGKENNLHHVMLAIEDAKLSFQLLVQVRNKVLDAYQDLMRM